VSQLVVATECPNCGASLDVSEGTNTVRCESCRSNLLVTGRKQVLSYYVPARVAAASARALAKAQHAAARVVRADLYFIPYYRLTGHQLAWQRPLRQRPADPIADDEALRNPMLALFRGEHEEARALAAAIAVGARSSEASEDGPLQLLDRYVEKSFLARDLPDFAGYSLGVRSQVLRVGLLRPGTLTPLGKAVGVGIDVEAAMTRGLQEGGVDRIAYRQVLARILSVIYFPYWVVELHQGGESWLTLVDGVMASVVQARAPLSLERSFAIASTADQPTAGFRPLVCPNCGWDLPVSPDDVVFLCASCEKAWQIHGTEMTEVPHEAADVNDLGKTGTAMYLPFWQLDASPRRYCVPAFRYRRLKALADLTTRLSAKPLRYERWTGTRPQARGCFYDADDAALLAGFVAAGQSRPATPLAEGGRRATLIWLPFKRESRALLDPFTGMGLQESLLL
jgi:DNA-directed RNA polymerase subunit RPC12/RpoP